MRSRQSAACRQGSHERKHACACGHATPRTCKSEAAHHRWFAAGVGPRRHKTMTKKPRCASTEALAAPFADDALPAPERASIEEHLARCPPCRQRMRAQETVRDLLA